MLMNCCNWLLLVCLDLCHENSKVNSNLPAVPGQGTLIKRYLCLPFCQPRLPLRCPPATESSLHQFQYSHCFHLISATYNLIVCFLATVMLTLPFPFKCAKIIARSRVLATGCPQPYLVGSGRRLRLQRSRSRVGSCNLQHSQRQRQW